MKRKILAIIIGIIIVLSGIGIVGNGLFDWNFTFFFDGWWALALMIVFLLFVISDGPNMGNILGLVIFGFMFARYYLPFLKNVNIWPVIAGIFVVYAGVCVVIKAIKGEGASFSFKFGSKDDDDE